MSRYTGPRMRVMRALGTELPGLSRKPLGERQHPPGQHGLRTRRKSDYGLKLIEKQKLRFNYGLTEAQLRRLFKEARRSRTATGERLLQLLESRLDNAVFRAGFAPTGIAARQLVRHRHVLLNGKPVNIPSIRIHPGDTITLTDKARRIPMVMEAMAAPALICPEWLAVSPAAGSAVVTRSPEADEVPFPINVQDVVEFYAVSM